MAIITLSPLTGVRRTLTAGRVTVLLLVTAVSRSFVI